MSLSDKMQDEYGDNCFKLDDVREAVKKAWDMIKIELDPRIDSGVFKERWDEIFGEKLS